MRESWDRYLHNIGVIHIPQIHHDVQESVFQLSFSVDPLKNYKVKSRLFEDLPYAGGVHTVVSKQIYDRAYKKQFDLHPCPLCDIEASHTELYTLLIIPIDAERRFTVIVLQSEIDT